MSKTYTAVAIAREEILERLQEYLESDTKGQTLTDEQLTDEACAAYADALGTLWDDFITAHGAITFDSLHEDTEQLAYDTLVSLGIRPAID